jgi:hypothetical protein
MKLPSMLYAALLTAPLLSACVVAPAGRGPGYVVAPALPLVVELGAEPYYYHSGYYYYYHKNRWSYAHSRRGPWRDLPRDRYPREVRHKGHAHDRNGGRNHGYR